MGRSVWQCDYRGHCDKTASAELEDTVRLATGAVARNNAELVAEAVALAQGAGHSAQRPCSVVAEQAQRVLWILPGEAILEGGKTQRDASREGSGLSVGIVSRQVAPSGAASHHPASSWMMVASTSRPSAS